MWFVYSYMFGEASNRKFTLASRERSVYCLSRKSRAREGIQSLGPRTGYASHLLHQSGTVLGPTHPGVLTVSPFKDAGCHRCSRHQTQIQPLQRKEEGHMILCLSL